MTYKKRPGRGGRRPGAGRPPLGPVPRIRANVTLMPADIAYLRRLGDGSVSLGIDRLIRQREQQAD